MGASASTIDAAPAIGNQDTPVDHDALLTPFPPELITNILEHLQEQDVRALMRVNSVFYHAIAYRVIDRVRITDSSGDYKLEAQHTIDRLFLPSAIVKRFIPALIWQVDLYPHSACANLVAPVGSKRPVRDRETDAVLGADVRVLRLFFGPVDGHQVLHTHEPPYGPYATQCRFLPAREPRTLVLRDPSAKAMRALHGLTPPDYMCNLRRQVHVLGRELVGAHGTVNGTIYLNWWGGRAARPYLESCEVVFWTPDGRDWLPIPDERVGQWALDGSLVRWFERMLRTLQTSYTEIAAGGTGSGGWWSSSPRTLRVTPSLTVVNAGAISPICYADPEDVTGPSRSADYFARESAIKDAFRALWDATLPPSLADRRRRLEQGCRFISFEQWVNEGCWRDVFAAAEVGSA